MKLWNNITRIRTVKFWLYYLNFAKNCISLASKNLFQTSLLIMSHSKQRIQLVERKTWSECIWLVNFYCQSTSSKITHWKYKKGTLLSQQRRAEERSPQRGANGEKQTREQTSRAEKQVEENSDSEELLAGAKSYWTFINH